MSGKFSCWYLLLHLLKTSKSERAWNWARRRGACPEGGSGRTSSHLPWVCRHLPSNSKCGIEIGPWRMQAASWPFRSITDHPGVFPSIFRSLDRDQQTEPHASIQLHFYRCITGYKVCKKPTVQTETSTSNWHPLICIHLFILGPPGFYSALCLSQWRSRSFGAGNECRGFTTRIFHLW